MSVDFKGQRFTVLSGSNWYTFSTAGTTTPTAVEPSGSLARGSGGGLYKSVAGGNWGQLGLYSLAMREVPTTSSTGLTGWGNQPGGATVTHDPQGLTIFCPSQGSSVNMAVITGTAPTPPYTIKTLLACTHQPGVDCGLVFGWVSASSGGKELGFIWEPNGLGSGGTATIRPFSQTVWNVGGTVISSLNSFFSNNYWFKLVDDGTTASIAISATGDSDWYTFYSTAKNGSFLGSGGFNQIMFGASPFAGQVYAKILSWQVTSP